MHVTWSVCVTEALARVSYIAPPNYDRNMIQQRADHGARLCSSCVPSMFFCKEHSGGSS